MKRLVLLRHFKSSWPEPGIPDCDRPLAPRGQRDAIAMAEAMVTHDLVPERILCSPARRTRETLAALEPGLGDGRDIDVHRRALCRPRRGLSRDHRGRGRRRRPADGDRPQSAHPRHCAGADRQRQPDAAQPPGGEISDRFADRDRVRGPTPGRRSTKAAARWSPLSGRTTSPRKCDRPSMIGPSPAIAPATP